MDKDQIWEVLQTCLLASDGADLDYLIERGFHHKISMWGLNLYDYLKNKQINLEVEN